MKVQTLLLSGTVAPAVNAATPGTLTASTGRDAFVNPLPVIPEPAAVFLGALGVLLLLFRRK